MKGTGKPGYAFKGKSGGKGSGGKEPGKTNEASWYTPRWPGKGNTWNTEPWWPAYGVENNDNEEDMRQSANELFSLTVGPFCHKNRWEVLCDTEPESDNWHEEAELDLGLCASEPMRARTEIHATELTKIEATHKHTRGCMCHQRFCFESKRKHKHKHVPELSRALRESRKSELSMALRKPELS